MSVGFWIGGLALALGVVALLTRPLWSGRGGAPGRAAHEAEVFKRQLEELGREEARGALSSAEAEAARREIGRKLLASAAAARAEAEIAAAPEGPSRIAALAAAGAVLLGGLVVYGLIGDPGRPDLPLAGRDIGAERTALQLTQAEAEASAPGDRAADDLPEGLPDNLGDLIGRMEEIVAGRPEDARGRMILGNAYLRLERPRAAYPQLERAAELLGAEAPAELWVDIGRARTAAAGGYVTREAEAAFRRAPDAPLSLVFIGQAEAERGDLRAALGRWATAYALLPDDAPIAATLLEQIGSLATAMELDAATVMRRVREQKATLRAAHGAGQGEATPPTDGGPAEAGDAPRGPSQADIAAAANMGAEERTAMIAGMVEGLAARLAEEPGDLEGWLRLLRAYGVLDRAADLRDAYAAARAAFAEDAAALARLDAAVPPEMRAPAAGAGRDP